MKRVKRWSWRWSWNALVARKKISLWLWKRLILYLFVTFFFLSTLCGWLLIVKRSTVGWLAPQTLIKTKHTHFVCLLHWLHCQFGSNNWICAVFTRMKWWHCLVFNLYVCIDAKMCTWCSQTNRHHFDSVQFLAQISMLNHQTDGYGKRIWCFMKKSSYLLV